MQSSPNLDSATGAKPLRTNLIFLANIAGTFAAMFFFFCSDMMTWNFFDWEAIGFILLITFIPFAFVLVVESLVFLVTKKFIIKKGWSDSKKKKWLYAPAWVFILAVIFYSLWSILPQQRLKRVCWGTSIKARNLQVVGMRGMQSDAWLGVFETDPAEFQRLLDDQKMIADKEGRFTEAFSRLGFLKRAQLYDSVANQIKPPSFIHEVIGIDGIPHGGIYATFDAASSRAIVFHTGY